MQTASIELSNNPNLASIPIRGVCGIYCFIHRQSGLHYVGSSTNIGRRLLGHMQCAKRGSMNRFHRALRAFGISEFDLEILEECKPCELLKKERFYIVLLNAASLDGLNTSENPAISRLGSKVSDATKARISASLKGIGKGRRASEETKRKIGESSKGRYFSPECRAIQSEKSKARASMASPPSISQRIQRAKKRKHPKQIKKSVFTIRMRSVHSEEAKSNISLGITGRIQTESEKKKRADWHRGKKRTIEQREAMRIAQLNMSPEKKARIDAARHKPRSAECRARMSAGRIAANLARRMS